MESETDERVGWDVSAEREKNSLSAAVELTDHMNKAGEDHSKGRQLENKSAGRMSFCTPGTTKSDVREQKVPRAFHGRDNLDSADCSALPRKSSQREGESLLILNAVTLVLVE
ncbi:hypothetical protein K438DRAFT_769295 [Mycena galopus ATCC 62051]|nr:hypothetical protein K438DRAFT_769295 [Mycena galopus ATCC 62051]